MKTADGKTIQPTGKSFHVEFCTLPTWNDRGEISDERLFYDQVRLMKQIELMQERQSLKNFHPLGRGQHLACLSELDGCSDMLRQFSLERS